MTGKVAERLHADRSRRVVGQEGGARQLRLAVDRHAAAAADAHAARPAVGQRAVDAVLDVVQAVEHDPVLRARDLVLVERELGLLLRTIPRDLQRDVVRHAVLASPRPARPAASG